MAYIAAHPRAEKPPRLRHLAAPAEGSFVIKQNWTAYSDDEHDRWNRLYARCIGVLENRACMEFLEMAHRLRLSNSGVPDMRELSDRIYPVTGWRVVPVAGLVPDAVFFELLANRLFPAGAFLRSEEEFDYLKEPDIFHDIFGHVPLLANPIYADFMRAYGLGGQRATRLGQLKNLARLYWYTIEFGLVRSSAGLRIFGAGILSSSSESRFSLESASPNRLGFDLERVLRTDYRIDDYQRTYFVIDDFDSLLRACAHDFGEVYARVKNAGDIGCGEIVESDDIVTRGTQSRVVESSI